jgi:membrane protein insertase Oxa1/YidC/SpoIIIJ
MDRIRKAAEHSAAFLDNSIKCIVVNERIRKSNKSHIHGPAKLLQYIPKTETMARFNYVWICFIALAMTLTSCDVIGGIFKAGFWTAIIIVVIVVALILWLVGKGRR